MIALRRVQFTYGSSPPVLRDIDLDIPEGRITAITGPSGRGKSTLLFIAGLLLRPTGGQVVVGGTDVARLPDRARSRIRGRLIGFVFQDAALDASRSVLDNVIESTDYSGASRRQASDRARALLADLGVQVDTRRRPVQISGGQAQRVAVCRALLPEPAVILADEPTGNLDEESARAVMHQLRAEADRGVAVAVATHDDRVIRACDSRFDLS